MKSKTKPSTFSFILTIVVTGALIAACWYSWPRQKSVFYTLLVMLVIMLVFGLCFSPVAIKVDSGKVIIISPLMSHSIPVSEIESVELFKPTMGAVRICGSRGFMGYWGKFAEGDIGKYTAYYGKASDCFMVRLKDGRKYLLGCENPSEMVDYINSRII